MITASVLLIVTAEAVVLSVLLSPSLTRTPVSSVNASLVPEPSSLVTTEIVFDASNFAASEPASDEPFDEEFAPPQPANAETARTPNNAVAVIFLVIDSFEFSP